MSSINWWDRITTDRSDQLVMIHWIIKIFSQISGQNSFEIAEDNKRERPGERARPIASVRLLHSATRNEEHPLTSAYSLTFSAGWEIGWKWERARREEHSLPFTYSLSFVCSKDEVRATVVEQCEKLIQKGRNGLWSRERDGYGIERV